MLLVASFSPTEAYLSSKYMTEFRAIDFCIIVFVRRYCWPFTVAPTLCFHINIIFSKDSMNDELLINMLETNQAKLSCGTIFKLLRRIKTGPLKLKHIPLALLFLPKYQGPHFFVNYPLAYHECAFFTRSTQGTLSKSINAVVITHLGSPFTLH